MTFPALHHDHRHCVERAMAAAEEACRRRGARLTDIRRRVLELVWASHAPVGAYGILDSLAKAGAKAAPPTVYRALDFLLAHDLIHRIERLNAFVGCSHPGEPHSGQFLLCGRCGTAAEMKDAEVERAVAEGAARLGFSVRLQTVEVEGLCLACRSSEAADDR
jgi:Fur family zinc uptake transcriptional regulator